MQISALKSKTYTFIRLLSSPSKMILPLSQNGFLNWMPDTLLLKLVYRGELGRKLNLRNPILFSEKIQWLKLHDRKQFYVTMVDKYKVKEIVAAKIGKEHVIPNLGCWKTAESIDFNMLPNTFVLKCTHDSGGIVICRDKSSFDQNVAIIKLKHHMKTDAYYFGREWPYKHVKRRIIAEKLLEDPENKDLIDYKFYCFGGEPKYCQVIRNRSSDETIDFYDLEWNPMPFTGLGLKSKKGGYISKPNNFSHMIEIARTIAQNTIFVRIDLYNISGKIYFGEFTLYPKSGFGKFTPDEWNIKIGDLVKINNFQQMSIAKG